MRTAALAAVGALMLLVAGCGVGGADPDTVQVYSGRHYDLERAFTQFTNETGIPVEILNGSDAELRERLKAEGEDTPADVFLTVDAGNLWLAEREGLLAPAGSPVLDGAVPAGLRDPDGHWYGLSMRVRTVMYNPQRVQPGELDPVDTYAALADPKWRDRVCMRTANSSYTQALVASMIGELGRDRAAQVVRGWVANGVRIRDNDVQILEEVAAGGCDVGVTNHYYLARLLAERPDLPVAPYWAGQQGRGVHVNISGAGIVAHSDNPPLARRFVEWLATTGQRPFVDGNHEFPANPSVPPEPAIARWGAFRYAPVDAEDYGGGNAEAVRLMAEAGYR
ncbi:extracellular solute-binding protein [Pseudonocardia sp. C8]|uniref:extracellular solute-binding protein n=1 Tax=Pseudonocardia sp. C8 TaxID=2762759 RepID=UPI001643211E|nr:extracellular solute-binding protein [Pseudonocardia sp. C8]MBC3191050.1 extracellular solute-binding protein [Pseudonocardia sp. C8]